MADRNLVIAGAGIGGLSAALCLARAGARVSIFEQAERLEEVGAGIQLTPNATSVLLQLGLGDQLKATVVVPTAISVLSAGSARRIVHIPLDGAEARSVLLRPDWYVCGTAASAPDARALVGWLQTAVARRDTATSRRWSSSARFSSSSEPP